MCFIVHRLTSRNIEAVSHELAVPTGGSGHVLILRCSCTDIPPNEPSPEGQVDTLHVQQTAPAWFTDSLHSVEGAYGAISHFKHGIRPDFNAKICDFHYLDVFLELK